MRSPPRLLSPFLLVVVALACSDLVNSMPEGEVTLRIVSGDQQSAEVGTELPVPIVVLVADPLGVPVTGVLVTFQGDGQVVQREARSNDQGLVSMRWTLGTKAGAQTMRATATAPNEPVLHFASVGVAGPPQNVSVDPRMIQVVSPGTKLDTLSITVRDRYANPIAGASVAWSVQQGGGTVTPLSDRTDLSGRARAIWTLGATDGLHRVEVTSGGVTQQISATAGPVFVASRVVAGSDHSCALTMDASVYCWGSNWTGQLGRGFTDYEANAYPVLVTGHRFTTLTAGGIHTCGLTIDGAAYCWGGNAAGQSGVEQPEIDKVARPSRITGVPALVTLTAGWFHTCGLTEGGDAYCWGDNSLGQLGRGSDRSSAAPVYNFGHPGPEKVTGSLRFSSIASSPSATSTCGVADGVVYCWGENVDLVLGGEVAQQCRLTAPDEYSGEETEFENPCSSVPVRIATRATATSVIVERYYACAVLSTQELECWGKRIPPTLIPTARVTAAWALWSTVCGEAPTGEVTCWLVHPPFRTHDPFGTIGALVNLHSSGRHSCGISRTTSVVYCWGSNFDGALGDGTTRERNVPGPVVSPLAVRSP